MAGAREERRDGFGTATSSNNPINTQLIAKHTVKNSVAITWDVSWSISSELLIIRPWISCPFICLGPSRSKDVEVYLILLDSVGLLEFSIYSTT